MKMSSLVFLCPAIFTDCFARVRGKSVPGFGWQAVATEGDDLVEMDQSRARVP